MEETTPRLHQKIALVGLTHFQSTRKVPTDSRYLVAPPTLSGDHNTELLYSTKHNQGTTFPWW